MDRRVLRFYTHRTEAFSEVYLREGLLIDASLDLFFLFPSEQQINSHLFLSSRALQARSWLLCLTCCFKLHESVCRYMKRVLDFKVPATSAMLVAKVAKLQPTEVSTRQSFTACQEWGIWKCDSNGITNWFGVVSVLILVTLVLQINTVMWLVCPNSCEITSMVFNIIEYYSYSFNI